MKQIFSNTNGFDKNIKFPSGNIICDGCLQGKTNNKSYKISETRASYPLELIHADLMEMPITSDYKHKYIVMIFDDYSSFATCTLI